MTTCTIHCSINSSQSLDLDSGHQYLQETRTNEFLYELDIDNNESVIFQINDFVHGGTSYTVAVTATPTGGTPVTWTHSGSGCVSPSHTSAVTLTLAVTATPSSGAPVTGGGIIRIEPKGKPD